MTYPVDRYQGDPKMFIDEQGSYFQFTGGQPVMDGGIENAVFMSLFTRKGWHGNLVLRAQSEKIGSDFEKTCEGAITKTMLGEVEAAARLALQWMVDVDLAAEIKVGVRNYQGRQLQVAIWITPPFSKDPVKLLLTRNGANWASQVIDPAYRR